jgi:hypothetical protein
MCLGDTHLMTPSTRRNLIEEGKCNPSILVDVIQVNIVKTNILHRLIQIVISASVNNKVSLDEAGCVAISRARSYSIRVQLFDSISELNIIPFFLVDTSLFDKIFTVFVKVGGHKVKIILWGLVFV